MTTAQVVETSVTVNNNSPIQNYVHPGDQTHLTFEMTPGFKPFTKRYSSCMSVKREKSMLSSISVCGKDSNITHKLRWMEEAKFQVLIYRFIVIVKYRTTLS